MDVPGGPGPGNAMRRVCRPHGPVAAAHGMPASSGIFSPRISKRDLVAWRRRFSALHWTHRSAAQGLPAAGLRFVSRGSPFTARIARAFFCRRPHRVRNDWRAPGPAHPARAPGRPRGGQRRMRRLHFPPGAVPSPRPTESPR